MTDIQKTSAPKFDGKVFERPLEGEDADTKQEWKAHTYCYAYANEKEKMNPAQIIYADSVEDVQRAVLLAKERGVRVAVRSGGHHYLGACSAAAGDNVILDMSANMSSNPEASPWKNFSIDAENLRVTCGPGVSLGLIAAALDNAQLWVPFGECTSVFIGGHSSSGGASPALGSFAGFLCDYMQSYTLVTADGEVKTVHRDEAKNATKEDSDLFWALAGASPGNFGVVVSVTFRVMHNSDCEEVIDFASTINPKTGKLFQPFGMYNKPGLLRVSTLWSKLSDELDLPEDQQVMPSGTKFTVSARAPGPLQQDGKREPEEDQVDWEMKNYEGGKFFDRAQPENRKIGFMADIQVRHTPFPTMVVSVQVFTRKGMKAADFAARKAKTMALFQMVDEALDWEGAGNVGMAFPPFKRDPNGPFTMSAASWANTHNVEKEYLRPYEKMNVFGGFNSQTGQRHLYDAATGRSAFAEYFVEEFDKIEGFAPGTKPTTLAGAMGMMMGGPGHKIPADRRNFTPFRDGPRPCWCQFQTWWGPTAAERDAALNISDRVFNTLVHPTKGLFATRQMMCVGMPWGSHEMDAPENRLPYWDTEENYQRLLTVKKNVDPNWTFTPNQFGIGATQPEAQAGMSAPPAPPAAAKSHHESRSFSRTSSAIFHETPKPTIFDNEAPKPAISASH